MARNGQLGALNSEILSIIQQILPYLILGNSGLSVRHLIMSVFIPIFLKMLTWVLDRICSKYWDTYSEMKYIDYYASPRSDHRSYHNQFYVIINWYLTKHLNQFELNYLHCDRHVIKRHDENNYQLNHFEPVYSLPQGQDIKFTFTEDDSLVHHLIIRPSTETKQVGRVQVELQLLRIYGPDLDTVKKFISVCQERYKLYIEEQKRDYYQYCEFNSDNKNWRSCQIQTQKRFDNIFLQAHLRTDLLACLEKFTTSKAEYQRFGIPYKKGLIFYGSPGCGKTSTIYAIANQYQRNIYFIRLSQLTTGEKLKLAVSQIPENSVVVFEDIDSHKVSHHRDDKKTKTFEVSKVQSGNDGDRDGDGGGGMGTQTPSVNQIYEESVVSYWDTGLFDTLLEILDGYNYLPGAIIILTTNHLDKLDPALIRSGRMDQKYHFTSASAETVDQILTFFYPNDHEINAGNVDVDVDVFVDGDGCSTLAQQLAEQCLSTAELINTLILPHLEDYQQLITLLKERIARANEIAKADAQTAVIVTPSHRSGEESKKTHRRHHRKIDSTNSKEKGR